MRAPERGWPSVVGRLTGLVASAGLLVWSATTSPAMAPDDGPSTQNARTVQEDSPERQRELQRLVRQGAEPDSGERTVEPDEGDEDDQERRDGERADREQADREQDAAEEQADRQQDAAEEQADRQQDAAEEGDEGDG